MKDNPYEEEIISDVFVWMAELMQTHQVTVNEIFKNYVQKETLEMEDGYEV